MPRYCQECGIVGGMLEIRKRNMPMSNPRLLCKNCFLTIKSKEQAELDQINNWKMTILPDNFPYFFRNFFKIFFILSKFIIIHSSRFFN